MPWRKREEEPARVGKRVMTSMGKCHIPNPEVVHAPENSERVSYLMPSNRTRVIRWSCDRGMLNLPFYPEEASYLPVTHGLLRV